MKIANKIIRDGIEKPFFIAEVGVNHGCKIDRAKKLIDDAVEGGADSVKFQAYKAGTISIKKSPSYWDLSKEPTTTQFELFQKYDAFGYKEFEALARHCESVGTLFSCTPFDFESADFLCDLMAFYKISSSDITNIPFIKHIARKNKPIILSTGASSIGEIDKAVQVIRETTNAELSLLHCVLNYPCAPEAANLQTIKLLKNIYPGIPIGYSDHVIPDPAMLTLTYSYLMGAVIIEKHFTDNKTEKGNDHFHSLDMNDLKLFFSNLKTYHSLKGSYEKNYLQNETAARKNARRSIVSARHLARGHKISWDDITFKRPAHGISPAFAENVIGAEMTTDLAADEPLQFEHLKNLVSPSGA